jgi:hypothetical protein
MDLEVSTEHSPMSGIDEYLIHNYPHPVRVMWTSDPRAYERLWFTAQDEVGEVFFVCGLGFYPNLGTAEAYALVNHNGVHRSVHAHRKMGDDRTDMKIGPFDFEIVEPFKQWHISLADNEFGLTYDMQWYDTKRAVFQQLGAGMIHNGRVGGHTAGYESFGEQIGTISVAGQSIALARDTYCGSRDHHWGVRDGVGGPKHWLGSKWPMSGQWVEFRDWSLWSPRVLYNLGDPRQGAGVTVHREHRIRFEPDTKIPISGEIDVYLPDGSKKLLTFERLGNQIGFLRCGMYGGINGGTPVGDIWHGMDVGETVMGETHDANDAKVRSAVTGQDNLHCRFECDGEVAYGIVEPVTPVCYEFAKAGLMGFSIIE